MIIAIAHQDANTIKYHVMIIASVLKILAIQAKVANILLLYVIAMMPAKLITVIHLLDVKQL
jgi:hypothetical protein